MPATERLLCGGESVDEIGRRQHRECYRGARTYPKRSNFRHVRLRTNPLGGLAILNEEVRPE